MRNPPYHRYMRRTFDRQSRWMEQLYRRYHVRQFVSFDPLSIVIRQATAGDREVAGLVAAMLAYGNVKAMLPAIERVLAALGPSAASDLDKLSDRQLKRRYAGFRYRVTDDAAITALLRGARTMRQRHGSLHAAFMDGFDSADDDVLPAAARWRRAFVEAAGHPLGHLLPDPAKTSACKRLMLYLRWMVRRDAIDPGDWAGIPPAKIIAPVDTHLHRLAVRLGWTTRKQITLATARDVTAALRRFDPIDPLRFDFALTRPGILRLPVPDAVD